MIFFFFSGSRRITLSGSSARLQAKGHSVRQLGIDAQWQSEGINRKSKKWAPAFISRQRGHFVLNGKFDYCIAGKGTSRVPESQTFTSKKKVLARSTFTKKKNMDQAET